MDQPGPAPVHVVLCVSPDDSSRLGSFIRHLSVGLIEQTIQVRLASSDPNIASLSLGPVQTVVHQPITWPVSGRRLNQLVDVLSLQPPTVVHALSAESFSTADSLAEAFDADLVLQVGSLSDAGKVQRITKSRSGCIIAASQPLMQLLEEQAAEGNRRIELIPPGVLARSDIACFAKDGRAPTLVCTSNLTQGAGIESLFEAVELLRERKVELMLFLLGRGKHEEALRHRARERGLASMVTLAHPLGSLGGALQSADLFVEPASRELVSIRSLEAMAAGVVVVTRANPACDHYRDGETAVICPDDSAGSLADAIERLITDRQYARRLARGGLEYIRAHHTVSGMAELTAGVYRRLALKRSTLSIPGVAGP